jgi:hypothetical protein
MSTIPKEIQDKLTEIWDKSHGHWFEIATKSYLLGYQLATDGREELEKENKDLRDKHYRTMSALQSSLKERIEELEKVLTGLVNLKELKDTEGKTEIYLQLQPIAWKRAKEIISKQSDPEWMPLPSPPKK